VPVASRITADDGRAMLAMALGGTGLVYGVEPLFAPFVASGALSLVLESWSTTGPGYALYYPSRRHVPTGLRALIDLIRELQPLGR
jgi:DNA-binding transcriptional LysR family regulator